MAQHPNNQSSPPDALNVLYLHGFASGPSSTKARYFAEHMHRDFGVQTAVPDLNRPTFSEMTISSQLEVARDCLQQFGQKSKTLIVGSSMGGLLATLLAQTEDLNALILLAPGFGLPRRWNQMLGANGLSEWKQTGYMDVFHYGLNKNTQLRYEFILDAERYATDTLTVAVPTLVFHGEHDETVPVEESVEFSKFNPDFVQLEILDDDHQLIKSLETIWSASKLFIEKNFASGDTK